MHRVQPYQLSLSSVFTYYVVYVPIILSTFHVWCTLCIGTLTLDCYAFSPRTLFTRRMLCYLISMCNPGKTIRTPYVMCYLYETIRTTCVMCYLKSVLSMITFTFSFQSYVLLFVMFFGYLDNTPASTPFSVGTRYTLVCNTNCVAQVSRGQGHWNRNVTN
jgi:hypothetical protein